MNQSANACSLILFAVLFLGLSVPAVAQDRSPHFDEPAEIVLPQNYEANRSYPAIAFPQATYGTSTRAADYFGVKPHEQDEFIVILPAGTFTRDDYLPDFIAFVRWYEERLLKDIERAREHYDIDPDQIYLAGFSLGGDLSWALSARNPDIFSGAVMSGTRASYPMTSEARKTLKERGYRAGFLIGEDEIPVRANGIRRAHQLLDGEGIETQLQAHRGAHAAPPEDLGREYLTFVTGGLSGAAIETTSDETTSEPSTKSPPPKKRPTPSAGQPNWQATPTYETVSLVHNFRPDPYQVPDISNYRITANAENSSKIHLDDCKGYINTGAPDVNLDYEAGRFPLTISAYDPQRGISLLIRTPDGKWICSDGPEDWGAAITFASTQSGTYNIWVGATTGGQPSDTRIHFTEYDDPDIPYSVGDIVTVE